MTSSGSRFAIYLAPRADSAWGTFAARWLGRCAAGGIADGQRSIEGIDPGTLAALTADPRRYGFHATLKPPFRLAAGKTLSSLVAALHQRFAEEQIFDLPALEPQLLGSFIALVPCGPVPQADRIAEDCVRAFDDWRAPLTEADIARRMSAGLDARGRELLARWGYPSVLDRFRLHFSLTGPLHEGHAVLVAPILDAVRSLMPAVPLTVDSVCLFEERAPGTELQMIERIAFTWSPASSER